MAKIEWIPLDVDAHHDPKVVRLIQIAGRGAGFTWWCLVCIAASWIDKNENPKEHGFVEKGTTKQSLAINCMLDLPTFEKHLKAMDKVGLTKEIDGRLFIPGLPKRMSGWYKGKLRKKRYLAKKDKGVRTQDVPGTHPGRTGYGREERIYKSSTLQSSPQSPRGRAKKRSAQPSNKPPFGLKPELYQKYKRYLKPAPDPEIGSYRFDMSVDKDGKLNYGRFVQEKHGKK